MLKSMKMCALLAVVAVVVVVVVAMAMCRINKRHRLVPHHQLATTALAATMLTMLVQPPPIRRPQHRLFHNQPLPRLCQVPCFC
jgi:hypothetical protein